MRRVLKTLRPALLIVLETEIWPNLYFETKRTGARVAIVNGRISDRAWPRYRTWKRLFAPVLELADLCFVQSTKDYERYSELGLSTSKLHIEANLKYDACVTRPPLPIDTFGAAQVWIAASTVGPNERGSLTPHNVDEDDLVLHAFQALAAEFPGLLLILAPRQPARFAAVAQKLERSGVRFLRRSARTSNEEMTLPGVLLLDTIGELSRLYSLANVVFVGGSLAPRGGHNILEPAAAGVSIIVGPHMQNFEAILSDFFEAKAITQIQREEELALVVSNALRDSETARELGNRARDLVTRQQGVSKRLANSLYPLYASATLSRPHNLAARLFLGALALAWQKGGDLKRRRAERYANAQAPLEVPVISIGGVTIGGSGKTPFTTYLATRLRQRGLE
ncbi:MAG: tetraacyldisaccharide 4'-kinase, partial [Acidobacteriaceae bacterium]|nr:tetraacyldisaccharide 4'-kinase [Acidobacteriaceae bacterium]